MFHINWSFQKWVIKSHSVYYLLTKSFRYDWLQISLYSNKNQRNPKQQIIPSKWIVWLGFRKKQSNSHRSWITVFSVSSKQQTQISTRFENRNINLRPLSTDHSGSFLICLNTWFLSNTICSSTICVLRKYPWKARQMPLCKRNEEQPASNYSVISHYCSS